MKFVRYQNSSNEISYGSFEGETIKKIEGDIFGKYVITDTVVKTADVKLLAPCLPSKIMCAGTNYMSHIKECEEMNLDVSIPKEPLIFSKPSTSIVGPDDDVVYPPDVERVDFEGELGIVIGKVCKGATKENALDYVLGATCLNDVSARSLQWYENQWTRGKGVDTFCPIGPIITDEIDPSNALIKTRLNGTLLQDGNTNDMIFNIPTLIEYISKYITLLPGDIVATGTPAGVAPMKVGDVVEIEIEGIGILKNTIV